jgi:UTP:GlnB (protein PII) uridylyltransferase
MLMQRYFWAAKTVTQMNSILLQNLEVALHGFRSPEPMPEPIDDALPEPARACWT